MPFKSKEELGGQLDSNINLLGRRLPAEKESPREKRNREMLSLLRRVKPHVASAVATAAAILNKPTAADASRLKAADVILKMYRELVTDLYDGAEGEEEVVDDINPAPFFSLHMIESKPNDGTVVQFGVPDAEVINVESKEKDE